CEFYYVDKATKFRERAWRCEERAAPAIDPETRFCTAVVSERDALRRELQSTRESLHDVRSALRELQAAVLARWKAERELASFYRERELQRAQRTERDPTCSIEPDICLERSVVDHQQQA